MSTHLRLGPATNSSSSHSIVVWPGAKTPRDSYGPGEFGWGRFTLSSQASKAEYYATMLKMNLARVMPEPAAAKLVFRLTGIEVDEEAGIDHQSAPAFPCIFGSDVPDLEYADDVAALLENERIIVLGGNDNDDEDHPLLAHATRTIELPLTDERGSDWTCRREGDGQWVLFNQKNGTKIRADLGLSPDPWVSLAPELVDMKITDRCDLGCKFCYQGSGPDGVDGQVLWRWARAFAYHKVFEVAIGGGEPTLHPDLPALLREFAEEGIVPNFSTASLSWLDSRALCYAVHEHVGAVGVSVGGRPRPYIDEVFSAWKEADLPMSKLSLHVAMGTVDDWWFSNILSRAADAEVSVVLLGFKRVGRGAQYTDFKPYPWWTEKVAKLREDGRCPRLAIDTTLAAENPGVLKALGIPPWLYEVKEGRHNMYIDAVSGKAGPSSFCPPEQLVAVEPETIADVFQGFAGKDT